MTKYLLNNLGAPEFTESQAMVWYHSFYSACYFFPIIGAIIADVFLGKYKTIIALSIVYCLGHLILGLFGTKTGLTFGLALIAIGTGGIKPCVIAHLGDQFNKNNSHLITKAYSWLYFSVSVGAC